MILSLGFNWNEKTQAEVGTITEGEWPRLLLRKPDAECSATFRTPTSAAVVADGLKLKRSQTAYTKLVGTIAFGDLADLGSGDVGAKREQSK